MAAAAAGGMALSAVGFGMSIAQAVKQAKAIKRASRQAQANEDYKFREFFLDSLHSNRVNSQQNAAVYADRGVDFNHGTPLSVEVDAANEMSRNIERMRAETEMRKSVIRANAAAGKASAVASGVGGGLSAVASGLNAYTNLGDLGGVSTSASVRGEGVG